MWIHFFQSPIIAYLWQLLVDGLIWAMLLKAQKLNFGQDWCKGWSKFWSWILINLWYDLKAVNLVRIRTLNPCDRCSFCNVCISGCKVKERNDDAPDNYNNPVHLVHQADLNALAQARVGRWWILRREGRTGNHRHHQHSFSRAIAIRINHQQYSQHYLHIFTLCTRISIFCENLVF